VPFELFAFKKGFSPRLAALTSVNSEKEEVRALPADRFAKASGERVRERRKRKMQTSPSPMD
jgi:hypothetical protein